MNNWIDIKDRSPNENEMINGRTPGIDEMGYLVTILWHNNKPCFCEVPITHWLPVTQIKI